MLGNLSVPSVSSVDEIIGLLFKKKSEEFFHLVFPAAAVVARVLQHVVVVAPFLQERGPQLSKKHQDFFKFLGAFLDFLTAAEPEADERSGSSESRRTSATRVVIRIVKKLLRGASGGDSQCPPNGGAIPDVDFVLDWDLLLGEDSPRTKMEGEAVRVVGTSGTGAPTVGAGVEKESSSSSKGSSFFPTEQLEGPVPENESDGDGRGLGAARVVDVEEISANSSSSSLPNLDLTKLFSSRAISSADYDVVDEDEDEEDGGWSGRVNEDPADNSTGVRGGGSGAKARGGAVLSGKKRSSPKSGRKADGKSPAKSPTKSPGRQLSPKKSSPKTGPGSSSSAKKSTTILDRRPPMEKPPPSDVVVLGAKDKELASSSTTGTATAHDDLPPYELPLPTTTALSHRTRRPQRQSSSPVNKARVAQLRGAYLASPGVLNPPPETKRSSPRRGKRLLTRPSPQQDPSGYSDLLSRTNAGLADDRIHRAPFFVPQSSSPNTMSSSGGHRVGGTALSPGGLSPGLPPGATTLPRLPTLLSAGNEDFVRGRRLTEIFGDDLAGIGDPDVFHEFRIQLTKFILGNLHGARRTG